MEEDVLSNTKANSEWMVSATHQNLYYTIAGRMDGGLPYRMQTKEKCTVAR